MAHGRRRDSFTPPESKKVPAVFIKETDRALLLKVFIVHPEDGVCQSNIWFPKSQVEYNEIDDVLELPDWLFNQKNMCIPQDKE